MPKQRNLDSITSEEAYRMETAEFKGMVIQSLKDIREDIGEIKNQNNMTRWISLAIAGVAGVVSGAIGKDIHI